MHPALWKLMRLTNRASWRRLVRGAKTLRGAAVLLFMIVGLGGGLASLVGTALAMRAAPEMMQQAGGAGPYVPLLLMVLFLQSVLGKNSGTMLLHFSPPEVEFLFSAPIRRRDLLLYKLWQKCVVLIVVALFLSLTPLAFFFRGWLSLFVGLTLSLAFISLASLATALLRLIIAESAHTRARRAVLIAAAILVAVAVRRTVSGSRVLHLADLAANFRSTWPGRVLLGPFEVFSNAMLAERWFPDLIGWAGAALAIDLGLLILVLRLDADYLEWSAAFSQRVYEVQQRIRKGGGLAASPSRARGRFPLPPFPWLGGSGPIARNQLILTYRKCRSTMIVALIFTTAILVWDGFWSGQSLMPAASPWVFSYMTFFFCTMFPVAFRGDLDQMDLLKTLPAGPLALTVGELGGCAAAMTGFQVVLLAISVIIGQTGAWQLFAAALLAPAVNWLLLATSNMLFLIYPVPTTPGASSDLNVAGRGCLGLFLQTLLIVPLLGIPAGLSAVAYLASGSSRTAMVATALIALWIEAVPMTLLVVRAFDRFDPSLDTPA
jgi:hypothetical protein